MNIFGEYDENGDGVLSRTEFFKISDGDKKEDDHDEMDADDY